MSGGGKRASTVALVVGAALVFVGGPTALVLGLRSCAFERFEIAGPAMEPGYPAGSLVFIDKTDADPEIGELVVAVAPRDDADLFARVVGLPGDTVALRGGALYRDEVAATALEAPLPAELSAPVRAQETLGAYTYTVLWSAGPREDLPATTVPEGHVFLMGDHRNRSRDSRAYGPVPLRNVKGTLWR